jgi:Phytochelatin synthase
MKRRVLIGLLAMAALIGMVAGAAIFTLNLSAVPPEAIQKSVNRAPEMLERAWRLPVAATFKPTLTWQSNASRCGPASIANVFRSFGDVAATEADVLAGTGRCRLGICVFGLTLDELAEVAQANTTRKVTVLRDLTPEAFREHLRRANDLKRRYIINFTRERIFGAGVGHHSPIGGYLEAQDLVFVLDVNRDFQPWLIERSRLFSAMDTYDGEKKRGLLLIE